MSPELVIATYRPHEGKDKEMLRLIQQHIPTLRKLDLITDRPAILARSKDGTYLEIFEWASKEAATNAHTHPAVAQVWEAMGTIGDFPPLKDIEECGVRFPHFTPVV